MKSFYTILIALSLLLFISFSAIAENKNVVEKAALSQLMQALAQNDYEAFIANGTAQFKRLPKPAFTSVEDQLGELIRGGYKAEYLTQLNQQGTIAHVWKISYETSPDNTLAKLIISNNKVAGFWLQ